jgi:molybdopterin molybdotransferase
VDICADSKLIPFEEALTYILTNIEPLQQKETIDLAQSLDRILAETVFAPIAVPNYDNSAMDGYAVRMQDCSGMLRVIGSALAGHTFNGVLASGEAVLITTGAVIPQGADTVVMKENVVTVNDNSNAESHFIQINHLPKLGEHIRRAGEDIAKGSQILPVGKRLSALDIGLMASLGIDCVNVIRQPRIALLTTGDELLLPGMTFESGKIYDSNRPMLNALLNRMAIEIRDFGIVSDDPEKLFIVFNDAMTWADAVISTGGVSVGEADFTKTIFTKLGKIEFWKIAMKPGKPFAFGRLIKNNSDNKNVKNCWFFGLPGNPVSSAVTYHQLVVPGLRRLSGEALDENKFTHTIIHARTQVALKKQPGRIDFQRGILHFDQGNATVTSAGLQSSGVLSAMAKANCYIKLDKEQGNVAEGEMVKVILFDGFIQ